MRFATIRTPDGTRAARLEGEELVLLDSPDVGALLASSDFGRAAHAETGASVAVAHADFATLVTNPSKVVCVGLNYRSHIMEGNAEVPEYPTLFAKYTEALIGARDEIILPSVSEMTDWEVELTAVIGSRTRHASLAEAEAAIAGFTVGNDISIRDYQRRTVQWLQGKTFEHSTPIGPYLTTSDEIDGARDLEISCSVDGEMMQQARTSDLLFSPFDVVSYISDVISLNPGDLVLLGTPAGVGHARKPSVFLKPGQVVRSAIEGIGECVNPCAREKV